VTDTPDEPTDEELLIIAANFPGVGSDADLPDVDRFRAGVSRLTSKAVSSGGVPTDSGEELAVFVLMPAGPPPASCETKRVPMLDRAREPLLGRVWFVTHLVTAGSWTSIDFSDDDDYFRFVTDELDLGNTPAIVFDPRGAEPQLRFYPAGLASIENVEALVLANQPISLEHIFTKIDLVHANQLVTPGANPRANRLWADSRRGIAAKNTEDSISALLAAGLQTAFPTCRVYVEQPLPTGRLDIEIEERLSTPGVFLRHAVLELKVLRGLNPNGTNVSLARTEKWISDGVDQAASYRDDRGALSAALCCFDMRSLVSGQACFAKISPTADSLQVELRSWHLFNSSAAYRRHRTVLAGSPTS
jgi:hypothetical protein